MKQIGLIIPVFKGLETLPLLLRSIDIQENKELCTIIIIDDEHNSQYANLITKYPELDIVLLQTIMPGSGPAIARNIGLDYLRGTTIPYVMFADADDEFLNTRAITCLYQLIQSADMGLGSFYEEFEGKLILHQDEDVWLFSKIYKMSIIKSHNIVFPNESYNEDVCFNFWYWMVSGVKNRTADSLYLWKDNNNSITRINEHEYTFRSFVPLCINLINTCYLIFKDPTITKEQIEMAVANRILRLYLTFNTFYNTSDDRINEQEMIDALHLLFDNCFDEVYKNIPEEYFHMAWQELQQRGYLATFFPRIGFVDFIKKIREG